MSHTSACPARWACAAALAALAAGCGPTPYEPAASARDAGYETVRLAPDRYLVSFEGNAATPRQTVESHAVYRAAEVAAQTGRPYFAIVEGDVERDVDVDVLYSSPGLYGFGSRLGVGPGFGFPYHSRVGYGAGTDYGTGLSVGISYGTGLGVGPRRYGYGAGPVVSTTDSYEAFITVETLESRPAGRQDVLATQDVLDTLGPRIERP